ncbi:MAG: hypothetical protein U9Q06_02930 [Nanoarchaeota archaeon]|nr:hypothetical protein [Nanoarchaeota archaeon]
MENVFWDGAWLNKSFLEEEYNNFYKGCATFFVMDVGVSNHYRNVDVSSEQDKYNAIRDSSGDFVLLPDIHLAIGPRDLILVKVQFDSRDSSTYLAQGLAMNLKSYSSFRSAKLRKPVRLHYDDLTALFIPNFLAFTKRARIFGG